VRKALASGVDKKTLGETIWGGELTMMDTIFDPATPYYAEIERAIAKYPYDPRASERLMNEAGFTKGPDGLYGSPSEGKLSMDVKSEETRSERPVLAAGWRQIGFDIQESVVPRPLLLDPETRSTFPALYVNAFGAHEVQQMTVLLSSQAGNAENKWRGENRGAWINTEYDRLVEGFNTTLDPNQRVQQRARIAKVLTEDLPSIVLSFNPNAHAYLASVKGITKPSLYTTGQLSWNIENWELAS
jgi:peptide/nickel transport system substrate-binding protein